MLKKKRVKKEILGFKTCGSINKLYSLPFPCSLCILLREKENGPLNTSQGEGGYNNVDDDKIIFIYLFSLCEAVAMKSRPRPHAGS